MEEKNSEQTRYEFKAEMKQLLNLIIHSLYTHPEVFLRELVSNSSDALNKLRFRRLTDSNIIDPEEELKITIELDKDANTFSIEDTGIGMSREDLINQIGTIASSGTLNFLKNIKESKQAFDTGLIGQFGVGFYSVFMVTDQVVVETRSAEPNSEAWKWVSNGENDFVIEPSGRTKRGTRITFTLKEEYKDFAQDWHVKSVLNKYSNFVDFPIYIGTEKVNTVTAIWQKKKDEIGVDELFEFYKYISNDYQKPMAHLILNIEGNINFKSILFFPETSPNTLFRDSNEKTLHLYSNRVFIQDDAKELLPEYLRFIKGVVDTEDLPLNVSREVTQASPVMTKIKNVLVGKILSQLEEWAEKDNEKYMKFYKNFGSLFKTGINSDFSNKKRLTELLRFESSKMPKGEYTSLGAYLSRMPESQKEIYYISGSHLDLIERNPNLEYFRKNDIEVLYLTDPVDIFTIPYLYDFEGKPLKSIDKADIEIKTDTNETEDSKEKQKNLIDKFKEVLGDRVEDVVASSRLVDSPATLVVGKQGMDPQMEKMMQMLDKEFTASKRILEINLNHKLLKNLNEMAQAGADNSVLEKAINQVFEGCMLIEGYMKNPTDFVARMTEFMTEATNNNINK